VHARPKTAVGDRLEVLKQVHQEVVTERDRLRDARAGFTSRLGPLPASAAIVIGLTGATANKVDDGWILAAGVLFGCLVVVSTLYSGLPPYRVMRGQLQREEKLDKWPGTPEVASFGFGRDAYKLSEWLKAKIELEERLCGALPCEQFSLFRRPRNFSLTRQPEDLQKALDVERSAFIVVQTLFVAIIGVLIAGIVCG
jgi:hypothetical protein